MRIKYNGKYINVKNQSLFPRKEFYAYWNDYFIEVTGDEDWWRYRKERKWIGLCATPTGNYIVDGVFNGTMQEVVQLCFNNIGYPIEKLDGTYEHPDCYKPNDNPYPLCVGKSYEECKDCCIYEHMDEKFIS